MDTIEKAKQLIITVIQGYDQEVTVLENTLREKRSAREGLRIALDKIDKAEREAVKAP